MLTINIQDLKSCTKVTEDTGEYSTNICLDEANVVLMADFINRY